METVNLSAAGDDEVEFDEELCIICQEHTQDKLANTQHGCDQIRSASDVRQDAVFVEELVALCSIQLSCQKCVLQRLH